ncbi:MAG: hypothetical protein OEY23_17045 [Acidimicrobiia bacterium]|nr:hypothetical protein [Acidimicrobiia bacterium]
MQPKERSTQERAKGRHSMARKGAAGALAFAALVGARSLVAEAGVIQPPQVEIAVQAGQPVDIKKEVTASPAGNDVEVCLLANETGSATTHPLAAGFAADLYAGLSSASASFAVGGYRDYPQSPVGAPGDWVYRQVQPFTDAEAIFVNAVGMLTQAGGGDAPEAQYDAITAAVGTAAFADPTWGPQEPCGFSDPATAPDTVRVLIVPAHAAFHTPPTAPYVNGQTDAIAALATADVSVVGLWAGGAQADLAALATATGGTTLPVSSNGTQVAAEIQKLVEAKGSTVTSTIGLEFWCDVPGLTTTFDPPTQTVKAGETATFTETITVDPSVPAGVYECVDLVTENGKPMMNDAGTAVLLEFKTITVT